MQFFDQAANHLTEAIRLFLENSPATSPGTLPKFRATDAHVAAFLTHPLGESMPALATDAQAMKYAEMPYMAFQQGAIQQLEAVCAHARAGLKPGPEAKDEYTNMLVKSAIQRSQSGN